MLLFTESIYALMSEITTSRRQRLNYFSTIGGKLCKAGRPHAAADSGAIPERAEAGLELKPMLSYRVARSYLSEYNLCFDHPRCDTHA